MCGNYLNSLLAANLEPGSPPRVRELPNFLAVKGQQKRITPACAGITLETRASLPAVRGSPPRVRELLEKAAEEYDLFGITPACAGITKEIISHTALSQDHPRVCGNYLNAASTVSMDLGSPPRVRELRQSRFF